ncbi:hypothetical protein IAT40_006204 [Kwoniella sp. CBS 6097]
MFFSQSVRCREMWEKQRDELIRRVDARRGIAIMENASPVGRKWLNTIPYFQPLRLGDAGVSAGLQVRTLARTYRSVCRCGRSATSFLHEDVCSGVYQTARHDNVRDIIARSLRQIPSTEVTVEPRTLEGQRRNDIGLRQFTPSDSVISLRGPGRTGRRNIDYDLKVYSCFGIKSLPRRNDDASRRVPETADPVEHRLRHCLKYLATVEDKADKNKPESRTDFQALVISTGGIMSENTIKAFDSWVELDKYSMARLKQSISISLLVSRARKMAQCQMIS